MDGEKTKDLQGTSFFFFLGQNRLQLWTLYKSRPISPSDRSKTIESYSWLGLGWGVMPPVYFFRSSNGVVAARRADKVQTGPRLAPQTWIVKCDNQLDLDAPVASIKCGLAVGGFALQLLFQSVSDKSVPDKIYCPE